MTEPTSTQNPPINSAGTSPNSISPVRCLSGALISGGIAYVLYLLTVSIAQTFATKPISSDNTTVVNITIAVRTLVVGMSALGTGIFGLVGLGLVGLAIQLIIQQLRNGRK